MSNLQGAISHGRKKEVISPQMNTDIDLEFVFMDVEHEQTQRLTADVFKEVFRHRWTRMNTDIDLEFVFFVCRTRANSKANSRCIIRIISIRVYLCPSVANTYSDRILRII